MSSDCFGAVRQQFKKEYAAFLDLLFPRTCQACGSEAGEQLRYLCWNCLARLFLIYPPFCQICGNPVEGTITEKFLCSSCSRHAPFFDIARSAALYKGILQTLVQDFKYHGGTWLAHDFASLMYQSFITSYSPDQIDAVTYVPLYRVRKRERSYNQARLLAEAFVKRLRKPLLHGALCRIRPTVSQTHLTASKRIANVKHAFFIRRKNQLTNKRVLLIDDVMTTGATVNECSRVFIQRPKKRRRLRYRAGG